MCRHPYVQIQLVSDTLQNHIYGANGQRLIQVAAAIGQTAEHEVAEAHTGSIFQIQGDGFDDSVIDSDISIFFTLTGITCLLLEHRERIAERTIIINKIREAKHAKIACAKSEVDTDDEQHIVTIPSAIYKELRDAEDIVHTLDRLGGVFRGELTSGVFNSGGDKAGCQFTAGTLAQGVDIDHIIRNTEAHFTYPFHSKFEVKNRGEKPA